MLFASMSRSGIRRPGLYSRPLNLSVMRLSNLEVGHSLVARPAPFSSDRAFSPNVRCRRRAIVAHAILSPAKASAVLQVVLTVLQSYSGHPVVACNGSIVTHVLAHLQVTSPEQAKKSILQSLQGVKVSLTTQYLRLK